MGGWSYKQEEENQIFKSCTGSECVRIKLLGECQFERHLARISIKMHFTWIYVTYLESV